MALTPIRCPRCTTLLPSEMLNLEGLTPCRACRSGLLVEAFPALARAGQPGEAAKAVIADDQASCFYHPRKQAVVPCDNCGRFLCSLCEIELGGRHLCPSCYQQSLAPAEAKVSADNSVMMYDNMALLFAILPFMITPLVSIYLVIRYWRRATSVLPRGKARFVLAILCSIVQTGLWSLAFFA